MLRYKNYIFFLLLIFSFNISSSQVIWRDSTGYIADTVYVDTTAFNLYGPFQYAKPTTASFLYLAPTFPNLSVPGWNNAIHNYQDKSFPYQSSPPYFNYNGVLYNPYDSRIFTDSLYGKLIGKLPENFLNGEVWIGAPVLNKPIYYRGSNGVGSVLKWKYAFFPYYKFPLYRNEDTVGVVFPDSLFFGGGISDSSVVADVIKINDTTLEVKRKAHIYNKGHYIRRTRLDSFLVSLSSSYYTYNNYYFDTTINNNYYNVDTNYYISNYYIDTNYYYTIYNIDTNIYIYQIDTNIYVTNNYYTANPDTFVTGIYAYMENDSLKIEITRSQGAPLLFTSVKLAINGMQKHGINDTTWHTGYPLNIWNGGTNYGNYLPNQNKLPSFLDYVNEQIRPSNTFATDMYVDKGINFIWRTNYGSWRMFGDYNNSNFRYLYDNELPGITFWYNNPFQGYGISTNRYLVINNGVIAGSMFAEDSCLGFTNGYWNRLVYKNDMTLNGVKPAKSFEDVVPLKQLYDSCIWRHGFTGTITSVSDFTICDDTIKMYKNDITYFDGLIKNVSSYIKKIPACIKSGVPEPPKPPEPPLPPPPPPPEDPPDPPDPDEDCKGSLSFEANVTGKIFIEKYHFATGDFDDPYAFQQKIIQNRSDVYIVVRNLLEDEEKGIENTDTLYMRISIDHNPVSGNWIEYLGPTNIVLAPGDSQVITLKLSENFDDYKFWYANSGAGTTLNSFLRLKFLALSKLDYMSGQVNPKYCYNYKTVYRLVPIVGSIENVVELPPAVEPLYSKEYIDCQTRMFSWGGDQLWDALNQTVEYTFTVTDKSFFTMGYNILLFPEWIREIEAEFVKITLTGPVKIKRVISRNGQVYDYYTKRLYSKFELEPYMFFDESEGVLYDYYTYITHFKYDTASTFAKEFTIPIIRYNERVQYKRYVVPFVRFTSQQEVALMSERVIETQDNRIGKIFFDIYDYCDQYNKINTVSDYDPGGIVGSPDTNTVVHDTLWIADRFAQHNILDTSSHKGISLNSTSNKNLPIWLYDGTQFIKSDYTINDIITSSADTVISIVDTNVIATKYYVDSKSNTADSSIFATRYWSDGLFLKKVDTTNKWQPKGDYASSNHSHTNYIQKGYAYADLMENNYIGNQSGQVAAGNHNHNGVYITPTDTTNKWQPKGNYASSDHQHTLTQIVGQGYNHNDIIKWDAYTSMWEVGSMPAGDDDLSKSDSNVYFYRPWKIQNILDNNYVTRYNPDIFGTLYFSNALQTSYFTMSIDEIVPGTFNLTINNPSYIKLGNDTLSTREYVRNYFSGNLSKADSNVYFYRPWKIQDLLKGYIPYTLGQGLQWINPPTSPNGLSIKLAPNSGLTTTAGETFDGLSVVFGTTSGTVAAGNHTHSVASPLYWNGNTLSIYQANSTTSGYLSSTDWNTFNNKASTDWVSSNFSTLGHNHDGSYLSLAGGSLSGSLHAPYFYMNGNLVATQSWVSGNYSPTSHTHSGYATESWVNSNFSLNSHTHTTFNNLSVSTLSAYDHITSADYIQAIGGFRTYNNIGSSGTISKTFVTGVSLNKTKDYIEYKDWGGNNLQMEVVTDVSLNVSTATITLQFDGGLYISSSGWSGVYKEGEIHLTMDEFEKLKNNTWQIDPEYLEFLQWKQWKKEQENKVKLATEKK